MDAENAFKHLKTALATTPVLALPDFTQPFVVETDASNLGIGVVLVQNGRPVAYYSHGLPQTKVLKSAYEIELFAIVMAVQKWKYYLIHKSFMIRSDQMSLKYLWEQKIPSHYAKWLEKLMGFQFTVEYWEGRTNKIADALSRVSPENMENEANLQDISVLLSPDVLVIGREVRKDPALLKIINQLETDRYSYPSMGVRVIPTGENRAVAGLKKEKNNIIPLVTSSFITLFPNG